MIGQFVQDECAVAEIFELQVTEAKLLRLFKALFVENWNCIHFGPSTAGGAWEIAAPCEPKIDFTNGYLTVDFVTWHFHLGIGTDQQRTGEVSGTHTARAEFFRWVDENLLPTIWGFRCFANNGEQQLTVYLPNPLIHLFPRHEKLPSPDWKRLLLWNQLRMEYLSLPADDKEILTDGQ